MDSLVGCSFISITQSLGWHLLSCSRSRQVSVCWESRNSTVRRCLPHLHVFFRELMNSAFTVCAEGFPSVALRPVHAASKIQMESTVSLNSTHSWTFTHSLLLDLWNIWLILLCCQLPFVSYLFQTFCHVSNHSADFLQKLTRKIWLELTLEWLKRGLTKHNSIFLDLLKWNVHENITFRTSKETIY